MSLGTVLGFAGAVIGNAILPGIGGTIGMMAGTLLGNLLDPPKYEAVKPQMQGVQTAQYGSPIPILFGTDCFTGTVIWQKYPFTEHGEKSGGKNTSPSVSSKTYSTSFAVLLCVGEIDHIVKIYADGRLWWPNEDGETPFTVYNGDEEQLPDPTMEAELGAGNVPGYRGWAYVVFTELMLKDFGERIPQLKFVVAMKGTTNGPVSQVSYNEDSEWPVGVKIDSWTTDWSASQTLPDPTTSITEDYYYIEVSPYAHRNTSVGTYVYADGSTVKLWQDWTPPDAMLAIGAVGPVKGLGAAITPLAAADFLADAGVEHGRYCHACALSADGRILIALTSDSNDYLDPCQQWHRIIDGVVEAEGTIDLLGGGELLERLSFGVCNRAGIGAASAGPLMVGSTVENNGKWIWTVNLGTWGVHAPDFPSPPNPLTMRLLEIGDDNVLRQYIVDPEWQSYGGPQLTTGSTCLMSTEDGYCGVIMADHPGNEVTNSTALYTRIGGVAVTSLADVINRITADTPLDPSESNTSLCEPILIEGGRVTGQMEAGNALQPWRQAYFVDATDGAVVRWVPRGRDVVGTFPLADLAARPDGDAPAAIIERDRKTPIELARRVTVTFTDPTFDYQEGAVASDERQVGEAKSDTTVNLAIVLPPTKAKQVAKTLLWQDHQGQVGRTWYTSFKYLRFEPTDVVSHPDGKDVRIDNKRILANNIIEFSGVETGGRTYVDSESEVSEGSVLPPQTPPAGKADAKLVLLDIPLRSDGDSDYAIKAAVGPSVPGKKFTGATILMSVDAGATWSEVAAISDASTMGATTTVLAAWADGYRIDYVSRVRVELDDPEDVLVSVSEDGLYNGANLCLIGAEVLQFMTADLIEAGVYELSGLMRGRKGTEQATGHGEGEQFVMLDTCIEIPLTSADLGVERQYKAVATGKTVASATTVSFTNSGVAMRCYAPGPVTGGADGDGDVQVDAIRRTRRGGEWQPFVDVPLGETTEKYAWEIWNSAYTECARTAETTTPTLAYTSAQQTSDFGAEQEWVYGRVAQVGTIGAGMFQRFRVRGAGSTEDDPVTPVPPYITWPTQPTPPTPSGPTPSVDYTITEDSNNLRTTNFEIGQRLVFKFTTPASPAITSGYIGIAEYQDPTYFRSAKLSTDAKGLSVVAEAGGTAVYLGFGALAAATDYYITLETAYGFGNPSGAIGAPCDVIVYISGVWT